MDWMVPVCMDAEGVMREAGDLRENGSCPCGYQYPTRPVRCHQLYPGRISECQTVPTAVTLLSFPFSQPCGATSDMGHPRATPVCSGDGGGKDGAACRRDESSQGRPQNAGSEEPASGIHKQLKASLYHGPFISSNCLTGGRNCGVLFRYTPSVTYQWRGTAVCRGQTLFAG